MRKKNLLILGLLFISFLAFADTSRVTLIGNIPETGSQSLKLGYSPSASVFSTYVSESSDDVRQKKEITSINLAEDGEYYFAIFTDTLVNYISEQPSIEIEVVTSPFVLEGKTYEEASVRQKVEFENGFYPLINKKLLSEDDKLINVDTTSEDNRLIIIYKRGVTKANLQLASFLIKWDGKEDLQCGWYSSLISVLYSKK